MQIMDSHTIAKKERERDNLFKFLHIKFNSCKEKNLPDYNYGMLCNSSLFHLLLPS